MRNTEAYGVKGCGWCLHRDTWLPEKKKNKSPPRTVNTSARADSSLGSCCIRECECVCVCAPLKTHTVPPLLLLLLRQTQPEFCGRNHKTSLVTTYGFFFFFDLGHVIAKLDTEKWGIFLFDTLQPPPEYDVTTASSTYLIPSDGKNQVMSRRRNRIFPTDAALLANAL